MSIFYARDDSVQKIGPSFLRGIVPVCAWVVLRSARVVMFSVGSFQCARGLCCAAHGSWFLARDRSGVRVGSGF